MAGNGNRKGKGGPKGPRHNWEALKAEFIRQTCTVREFCERRGLILSTVASRASADGWMDARRDYQIAHAADLHGKAQKDEAREADLLANQAAMQGLHKAIELMEGVGDARDLKACLDSVETAWKLTRRTVGLPVEFQASTVELTTADAGSAVVAMLRKMAGE